MPRNVWSAGVSAFEDSVARRRQRVFEDEDRARRARLDQETAADRQEALDIRRQEAVAREGERAERTEIRRAAETRETQEREAAQKHTEALGALLDQYTEAVVAGAEDMKQAIGLKILNMGGKLPTAPPRAPQDPGPREVGGKIYEFRDGKWVVTGSAPAKDLDAVREDPTLPTGFKRELEWFSTNGKNPEESLREVARKWNTGEYRQRYPNADLARVKSYLLSTFAPDQDDVMRPGRPLGDAPAPAAAPPPAAGAPAQAPPPALPQRPATVEGGAHTGRLNALVASEGLPTSITQAPPPAPPVPIGQAAALAPPANLRPYTGEVRQAADGRTFGLVNGQMVEVVATPQGWVMKQP